MLVARHGIHGMTSHQIAPLRQELADASGTWGEAGTESWRTITHSGMLYERLLHELTLGWFTISELSERTGLSRRWVASVMTNRINTFPDMDIRTREVVRMRPPGWGGEQHDSRRYHLVGRKAPAAQDTGVVLDWRAPRG